MDNRLYLHRINIEILVRRGAARCVADRWDARGCSQVGGTSPALDNDPFQKHNFFVAFATHNIYVANMNARELKKWLQKQGCEFENHKGGSGHLTVKLNGKKTQLPMHGQKELGTGLVDKIKKDLGLK
jgi:mRNA interferase HicA